MLKKEMYKHKEKLMSNNVSEDIVLYKQGMTVSELANNLNVSGTSNIRRTGSLSMFADDDSNKLIDPTNLITIKSQIEIYIGL